MVLFDIYGTLLRSTASELHPDPELRAAISEVHSASPHPFPEVDIRDIHAGLHPEFTPAEIEDLALQHEHATNPVSSMPGAREVLEDLVAMGLRLGLVSNAQFYTVPVLEEALGAPLTDLGLDPALFRFSYLERRAKPDPWLFESTRDVLEGLGVKPEEVIHVGNDVRNDIAPARMAGFATVLFAGDGHSLRLRGHGIEDSGADHVIRDLQELLTLVRPTPELPR